jgi:glycosyltransferase involved in cell wall biosynthesis
MDNEKESELLISIIIPVYNVEQYLEKCLRSCAEQDIETTEFEIIAINDGSKDSSLDILKTVASEYKNIIIVSQENLGLGAARNKGLSIARGNFVWFVDSDDWIEKNCLRKITCLLFMHKLEALTLSAANHYNGRSEQRHEYSNLSKPFYSGLELLNRKNDIFCVPFTIYNRKFINTYDLKFMEGVFHEDLEFTPRSFFYANRIGVLNDIIYHVNHNPHSISRTINYKRSFDTIKVAESLSRFSLKTVPVHYQHIYDDLIAMSVNNALHNCRKADKRTKRQINQMLAQKKFLFNHLITSTEFKYRVEGYIFSNFPRYCTQIYILMHILK